MGRSFPSRLMESINILPTKTADATLMLLDQVFSHLYIIIPPKLHLHLRCLCDLSVSNSLVLCGVPERDPSVSGLI